MKVERVSYAVMTPSAARGCLEAIFWEPQFRWVVTQIDVLRPLQYISFTRNEVQKKVSGRNVQEWMRDFSSYRPFFADTRGREEGENATQRTTLALRDVAYVVTARALVDGDNLRPEDTPEKYAAMFERRVANGQCWHRPYLGCREFVADFGPPDAAERPIEESMELGLMLYDVRFAPRGSREENEAVFFEARLEDGVLRCDPDEVLADEEERRRLLAC